MRRIYDLLESTYTRHHVSWDNGIGIDLDALQREIGLEQLRFFGNAGSKLMLAFGIVKGLLTKLVFLNKALSNRYF